MGIHAIKRNWAPECSLAIDELKLSSNSFYDELHILRHDSSSEMK
jgi:hypothetical protein